MGAGGSNYRCISLDAWTDQLKQFVETNKLLLCSQNRTAYSEFYERIKY